jgi:hypothetical protein
MLCSFAGHGLITAELSCDAVLSYAGECPAPDIHGYPPAECLATIATRVQFEPLSPAQM